MTGRALILLNIAIFLMVAVEYAAPYTRATIDRKEVIPNGCQIEAVSFQCSLAAQKKVGACHWSRTIGLSYLYWFHRPIGHAVLAYDMGEGYTQIYDVNLGSYSLDTNSHDIKVIAEELHRRDRHVYYVAFEN